MPHSPHSPAQLQLFHRLSRFCIYKSFSNREAMSSSQECLQLFLPFFGRGDFVRKRPDPFPSREVFGGSETAFCHMLFRRNGVAIAYMCSTKVFVEPPFAVATAYERTAARRGKLCIVNIAQFGKLLDKIGNIGSSFSVPATLTDFAGQISCQLALCGCIFSDIVQRQGAQSFVIQRRCRFFGA